MLLDGVLDRPFPSPPEDRYPSILSNRRRLLLWQRQRVLLPGGWLGHQGVHGSFRCSPAKSSVLIEMSVEMLRCPRGSAHR